MNLNQAVPSANKAFSFCCLPTAFFSREEYRSLSLEAVVLYSLMLDRLSLSAKHGWVDSEGRVYIVFSRSEAAQMLRCGEKKATQVYQELEKAGLIERKKQGQGNLTVIYLFDFSDNSSAEDAPTEEAPVEGAPAEDTPAEDECVEEETAPSIQTGQNDTSRQVEMTSLDRSKSPVKEGEGGVTGQNDTSRQVKTTRLDRSKRPPIQTNINQTNTNQTDILLPPTPLTEREGGSSSRSRREDEEEVRGQIGYDGLWAQQTEAGRSYLTALVTWLAEIKQSARRSPNRTVAVGGSTYTCAVLAQELEGVTAGHIEHTLAVLTSAQSIANPRSYALTVLLNALRTPLPAQCQTGGSAPARHFGRTVPFDPQPTSERIQQNNDWLDSFLAGMA